MTLSTHEHLLVEQRLANERKSTGVAYLLWFLLGGFGGHRFYLGQSGTAAVMLALTIVGILASPLGVGFVLILITGIWALVDAFLIPGMIARLTLDARSRIATEVAVMKATV